jgi:hypothetical protein
MSVFAILNDRFLALGVLALGPNADSRFVSSRPLPAVHVPCLKNSEADS